MPSAIGVSTFFRPDEPIPPSLVLRLAEVNIASIAVACFLYEFVLREARRYYKSVWADDTWFWRFAVVYLVFACAACLALLATAVGVGLRDIQNGTYARSTYDILYIAYKCVIWTCGMAAELFFTARVSTIVHKRALKPLVWVLYALTACPYALAFCFFLLYRYYEFRYGRYSRILDLSAGWMHVVFVAYSTSILGWRLVLQRRHEARAAQDSLKDIFRGALLTSALIGLCAGMGGIFACFLETSHIYMLTSFWYNVYPFVCAMSLCFALRQRHELRVRQEGRAGTRKRAGRMERLLRLERADQQHQKTADHPSEWRGDKVSLGPKLVDVPDKNGKRRGSQRGHEKSFHDVALDLNAFERCRPAGEGGGGGDGNERRFIESASTGRLDIRVHTEVHTEVESEHDDEEIALEVRRRHDAEWRGDRAV
ncbi:uncharacterized protein JCM10292_006032 [Rhodotorula paludigena]|uniref:uncharacterized protein n=1 Tax=Rhodotorula paludigena TaxID=86838 RepID=UPI00317860F3